MIYRLPRESHFMASLYDDEDLAEQLFAAQQEAEKREQKRTLLGYSDTVDALYNIADRIGALYSVTVQIGSEGKSNPDVPPMPRPETAVDRVRDKKFMQRHRGRVARLLGRGGADG